ncbi:hypothetical protein WAI453_007831 [Rhynchosporium graminicola]|uniref:Peptidase A1 domain-containing protein n=1 Tax=Rhynchosporium graminicola TaxID=2792576 RepID=A0A1E1KUZ2_9HELO|nr:uncharacterized protein RCO7_05457 [Rhynchosporium commune]
MPQDVFEPILEIIQRSGSNGTHLPISGSKEEGQIIKFVDCKLRNTLSDRTITLGFGGTEGAKIEVPIQDLIRPAPGCNEETIESMQDENGPPLLDSHCPCYLAIDQSPKSHSNDKTEIMVLGDALLRHAYVVYDLQNNVIGMAQRNFNSDTSNIVEFGKKMKGFLGMQSIKATASTASRSGGTEFDSAFWALMVIFGWLVFFA